MQSLRLSATRTRRCPPANIIRARHERPNYCIRRPPSPGRRSTRKRCAQTTIDKRCDGGMAECARRARPGVCPRVSDRGYITMGVSRASGYTSSLPRSRRRTVRRTAPGERQLDRHSNRQPTDCRELSNAGATGARARASRVGPRPWAREPRALSFAVRRARSASPLGSSDRGTGTTILALPHGPDPARARCRGRRSRHAELGAQ